MPNFRGKARVAITPVVGHLTEIGANHEQQATQVAIRWLLEQDNVLSIPGAKNANQAQANARALTFTLTSDEVHALEGASRSWCVSDNWPAREVIGTGEDRTDPSTNLLCAWRPRSIGCWHSESVPTTSPPMPGATCATCASRASPRLVPAGMSSSLHGREDHAREHDLSLVRSRRRNGRPLLRRAPESWVTAVHHAPADYPSGAAGDVLTVEFTVAGIPCLGLNGGPDFPQTEAFSFQIATDDQERPTATGTPSSATEGRRAPVAGARTAGASHGRSHPGC